MSFGIHDPKLVTLSVLVAIFSSWMGLQITGRTVSNRTHRAVVLAAGSLALGAGVWAMHFIGMLAYTLCAPVYFDHWTTILSAVPSIGASFIALRLISRPQITRGGLIIGGVLVGAGIGAMHYAGMAGMRTSLSLHYDPFMFGLSIAVAVVLATLALWVRSGLARLGKLSEAQRLLLAAVVMGGAIAAMHYTGMAAARFSGVAAPGGGGHANAGFLALSISVMTIMLSLAVVAANGMLRYRQMFLELSRSDAWMRAMLNTTVDAIVTLSRDGVITEFNTAAERMFGWKRTEIIGRNVSLMLPEHERSAPDGLPALLREGRFALATVSTETTALRKDGTVVPVRRAIGHAKLGQDDRFVCFITDISERRTIEQALRASERQFRSLIGNIPGVSYRSELEGPRAMVFISDAVERVTGYPASDFVGATPRRSLNALIHAEDRMRVKHLVAAALRADHPYLVEYRVLHADGAVRWLWENGAPVRDEAGQMRWIDAVVLDITERRQMEEALREAKDKAEQAAAARATFVANMSHEIRTPMNSILGFTDVLLDGELNEEQRRHLDTIRNSGRSLLRLLNEILDTAKLEKGAVELEVHDYNLLSLIDELSSTLAANARAKGLRLDIEYDPAVPTGLRGDELRMRQVLTNLLDNAIKFTSQGSVTLGVHAHDHELHITVSDTGIGIAPERLNAIFDPFTQADASMTRRFGGTGLGTTICKQLVELMGGRIWADSTPGQGTTFHVQVPLVLAQFAQQPARVRSAAALPPLKVLVADDVPQNLELIQLLLSRRGHIMTAVRDGASAVELANSEHFDVALMDFQMPVLDGLSATRAIRAHEAQTGRKRLPVIAMTASVLAAHRKASIDAGMDGFASKPIDWFTLSNEIARVLGLALGPAAETLPPVKPSTVFNRQAGLRRWSEREDAFNEALQHFDRQYANLEQQLRQFASCGDAHKLRMLAHKVRGVAANLGLELLAEALGNLEQLMLGTPPDTDRVFAALDASVLALNEALPLIRATAPVAPAPATDEANASIDLANARRAIGVLKEALERGALNDDAMAKLTAAIGAHPGATRVSAAQAAIADFDFDLAIGHLDAVLALIEDEQAAVNDASGAGHPANTEAP